jgi:hypothetical protein
MAAPACQAALPGPTPAPSCQLQNRLVNLNSGYERGLSCEHAHSVSPDVRVETALTQYELRLSLSPFRPLRPIQLPPPGRNDCGPGGRRGTIPYHTRLRYRAAKSRVRIMRGSEQSGPGGPPGPGGRPRLGRLPSPVTVSRDSKAA